MMSHQSRIVWLRIIRLMEFDTDLLKGNGSITKPTIHSGSQTKRVTKPYCPDSWAIRFIEMELKLFIMEWAIEFFQKWDFRLQEHSRVSDGVCTQNTLPHALFSCAQLVRLLSSLILHFAWLKSRWSIVRRPKIIHTIVQHVVQYTFDEQHTFTWHLHSFFHNDTDQP